MPTSHTHPFTFTETDFQHQVVDQSLPILVDFWAPWCGPCRLLAPVLDEIAADFEGRIIVGKVNVDEQPQLAARYGIRSIPTLLIFKDGQVVDQTVGGVPKHILEEKLRAVV
jgi:thioredoxin 1